MVHIRATFFTGMRWKEDEYQHVYHILQVHNENWNL